MMPQADLLVRLLHPAAVPPARTRPDDAGHDLRSVEAATLPPGGRATVGTGLALAIPPGVAGLVMPRSGLAANHGVTILNAPGLIDPNYRGEVRVVLHNTSTEPFEITPGDRIAQLLLVPYWAPAIEAVETLPDSERGASGFGSSGR